MQTEEEIERNIEVDKDSNNDTSNNLHKNRNLPNKSEVQSTPLRTDFPMGDSPACPKNAIFTPFETSTSILSIHHQNEVSLLSLSRIGTSRLSIPLTRTTSQLSPSSSQTSWCPRSSSTRETPLISYIGELSRGLRSPQTLSTFTSVHSLALQAREQRLRGLNDHFRLRPALQELHNKIFTC